MAGKKIIRKITKVVKEAQKEAEQPEVEVDKVVKSKKTCFFCQDKTSPSYVDIAVLRRFITDRIKIMPRLRSNVCSKHQRAVTKQIKYARHLALLPFIPKV